MEEKIKFQLSPLHEGRPAADVESKAFAIFQLSPLHEGRQQKQTKKSLFLLYYITPLYNYYK